MENLKTIENSLLRLSCIGPQLRNYLRGWELAQQNYKDFNRDVKGRLSKKNLLEV